MRKFLYIIVIGILWFLSVSDSDAYFSADRFSFPAWNPYLSGSLDYFSWVTFYNVRLSPNWPIVYSSLNGWFWTSADYVLVTDNNNQLMRSVSVEVWTLWNCNIYQYSTVTRVWTGLFCPAWRIFSGSLNLPINVVWPPGATWTQWIQGIPWFSAYEVAQLNWYTGSEIEWLWTLIGPMGMTGATGALQLDLSNSWAINIVSTVNLTNSGVNGELSESGTYIPMVVNKDWTYFLKWEGIRNILLMLTLFFLIIIAGYKYWKNQWQF